MGNDGGQVGRTVGGRIRLHRHFYVAGVLLLVGIFGFNYWFDRINRLMAANKAVPLRQPLATIPGELGEWVAIRDIRLPKATEQIAGAADYINRVYVKSSVAGSRDRRTGSVAASESEEGSEEEIGKDALQVYVAYFAGIRLAAPHSPDVCMRGAGWTISGAHRRTLELGVMEKTEQMAVNVHLFEREYERQMVVWWDYIHGKNITNPFVERVRWVLPLFLGGKAGSVVQVQISKDIEAGQSEEEVYNTIVEFGKRLAPEVGKCLPEPL